MLKTSILAAGALLSASVMAQDFESLKGVQLPEPRTNITYTPGTVSLGESHSTGGGHIDIGHTGTTPSSIGVRLQSGPASGGVNIHGSGVTIQGGHNTGGSGVGGSVTTSGGKVTGGSVFLRTTF